MARTDPTRTLVRVRSQCGVKFYNVPFEFLDEDGLCQIASRVRLPLYADKLTENFSRVSFARICIDIEADSKLPYCFPIQCEEEVGVLRVEYQTLPPVREHCKVFGHLVKECSKAPKSRSQADLNEVVGEWYEVPAKKGSHVEVSGPFVLIQRLFSSMLGDADSKAEDYLDIRGRRFAHVVGKL